MSGDLWPNVQVEILKFPETRTPYTRLVVVRYGTSEEELDQFQEREYNRIETTEEVELTDFYVNEFDTLS